MKDKDKMDYVPEQLMVKRVENGHKILVILCRFCKKDISLESTQYGDCSICKKGIVWECELCHRAIVHKDHVEPEIIVNMRRTDLSADSHAQDATNAIKQAERAEKLPWWNYYE